MRDRKLVMGLFIGAVSCFMLYTVMAWLAGMDFNFAKVFVNAVHNLVHTIVGGIIVYNLWAKIFLPRILK